MSELTKIFLTSALTIFGSVLVFVFGQLISKFVIEPIHSHMQLLGRLRYSLIYFAGEIHTPVPGDAERCQIAHDELRKLSSDISASIESIPWYNFWYTLLKILPCRELTLEAASELIGMSNTTLSNDRSANTSRELKIKRILK